jgi:hypothetical protein
MTAAILQSTSAGIASDLTTFVVLRWERVDGVVGYRLYRAEAGSVGGRSRLISGRTPVGVPQSARELRAIVRPGTQEWDTLASLLAAAAGAGTPVDPAAAFDRGLSDAERSLIQAAAQASLTMGRIAGVAYIDRDVQPDVTYTYELHGVDAGGATSVLAQGVPVTAGWFKLPDSPSGVTTQAGDRRVLVLWNRNPYAATFAVERATSSGGPYARVNRLPIAYDIDHGLDGLPLTAAQPGFLDIGAWNADGEPTTHDVAGTPISGPDTGITYFYRVASVDELDRQGPWSSPVAASPTRSVAPMAPDELQVTPDTSATGLVVQWRTVTRNVENHAFVHQGTFDTHQLYRVYRADTRDELEDIAGLPGHLATTVSANPNDTTRPVQEWHDTDPVLRPAYGTRTFFYRVRVHDAFGIPSAPSAVIGAAVPDIIPPGPTTIVRADGHADHIRLEWNPNSELDVAGYQVFRGVCDHGYLYVPGVVRTPDDNSDGPVDDGDDQRECDMSLVGDVTVGDARAMIAVDGVVSFEDYSIPSRSPLCYAYWVRAYDFAGNLYEGNGRGCPAGHHEYRCAALRNRMPPQAPVITGLRARNRSVLIEWVAAPEQDLRAFHVYRSDRELDPPTFLACIFTDGTVSTTPWVGTIPSCTVVPAAPSPLASRGSYLDDTAAPHRIYWYRVAGVDWLGNESSGVNRLDLPASSTFTYTSNLPATPTILTQVPPTTSTCGLTVTWTPPFDPSAIQGYVVFRGTANGAFRQVSDILTTTSFTDATARRGIDYLYRIQAIDHTGTLSEPSPPTLHRY